MANEPRGSSLENVGSEISPRHDQIDRLFDGRPPLRINQYAFVKPVRDELLARRSLRTMRTHLLGEGSLGAAGHLDGLPESDDMGLIDSGGVLHGGAAYTNQFVLVNKPDCVTTHKAVCNIVNLQDFRIERMPSRANKLKAPNAAKPEKPRKERKASPWADGKTFGDRIRDAMIYRAGQLRREYKPADLIRDVNELANAPIDKPILSQQLLSSLLKTGNNSGVTALIASVCGVDPVWLTAGIGKMVPDRTRGRDKDQEHG